MKGFSVLLFSLVFLAVLYNSRGQNLEVKDSSSIIHELYSQYVGDDCRFTRYISIERLCNLVEILPRYKLCLQDLINYLLRYCNRDCTVSITYLIECGCFQNIIERLEFPAEKLIDLIEEHNCNINEALHWIMCK